MTQLDRPVPGDAVERSLIEDPVGRLRARAPITIRDTTTVRDAICAMLADNIGALLVVDADRRVVGIFSERDLLTKIAGLRDDYAQRPVSEFMTRDPESVGSHHTLAFALHKMDCGGYRHVPILENGRAVGMISVRDMLRHITQLCRDR
jgi:CBS domain-containing protein